MASEHPSDVTRILRSLESGEIDHRAATDAIFAAVSKELRQVASRVMSAERLDHTLQPTAIVNEAYLRLVDADNVGWQNRAHFFGVAAYAMRQILMDHPGSVAQRSGAAGGNASPSPATCRPTPLRGSTPSSSMMLWSSCPDWTLGWLRSRSFGS